MHIETITGVALLRPFSGHSRATQSVGTRVSDEIFRRRLLLIALPADIIRNSPVRFDAFYMMPMISLAEYNGNVRGMWAGGAADLS